MLNQRDCFHGILCELNPFDLPVKKIKKNSEVEKGNDVGS